MKNTVVLILLFVCQLLLSDISEVNSTSIYDIGSINDVSSLDMESINGENYIAGIDLSDYSYSGDSFTFTETGAVRDIVIGNGEASLYALIGQTIYQYDITDLSDLSTISYTGDSFAVGLPTPYSLELSNDGLRLLVLGASTKSLYQFPLSIGWDISTAQSYTKFLDLTTESTSPYYMLFNDINNKLLISDVSDGTVYQYSIVDTNDISLSTYDNKSIVFPITEYVLSLSYSYEYENICFTSSALSTQYLTNDSSDITTITSDNISIDLSAEDSAPIAIKFWSDYDNFIMLGTTNKKLYRYSK